MGYTEISNFKKKVILEDVACFNSESGKLIEYVQEIRRKSDNKILGYVKISRITAATCRPWLGRFDRSIVYKNMQEAVTRLQYYVR